MNEEEKDIKITVRVPDKVGVYKLNRIARKRVALDLISKYLKLFDKMRGDVTEIILVVDGKRFRVNRQEVDSIKSQMIRTRRKYKNKNNFLFGIVQARRANNND